MFSILSPILSLSLFHSLAQKNSVSHSLISRSFLSLALAQKLSSSLNIFFFSEEREKIESGSVVVCLLLCKVGGKNVVSLLFIVVFFVVVKVEE